MYYMGKGFQESASTALPKIYLISMLAICAEVRRRNEHSDGW